MRGFNYKHLYYFWAITKSGGVAKAGEQLHVTPQSMSTQMRQLERDVGEPLWRRVGRRLELTDIGHLVFDYADRIFSVGEELKEALRDRQSGNEAQQIFRVGITGAVVKVLTWRLLEPIMALPGRIRLVCREGRFRELMSLLAVHELDLVISDRPLTRALNVRGFNHELLESGTTFLARPSMARRAVRSFPESLDMLPLLMPGVDSAVRPQLMRWFDQLQVRPQIIGEFDDTALLKVFGQAGAGCFPIPTVVSEQVAEQFQVMPVGSTEDVRYQIFAISPERTLSHPAVQAISENAGKILGQLNHTWGPTAS